MRKSGMFETIKASWKLITIQKKQTELIKVSSALNKLEKINRKNEGKIQEKIVSLEKEIEILTGINRPIRKNGLKIQDVEKIIYSVDESTTKKTDSKILDDGTYFVEPKNIINMRKALKTNGLEKVSIVKSCAGIDNVLEPRKNKDGKSTIIPTDEWNKKIQNCNEVMQFVKNGKPTPFNRGKRQYAS
jgi:flagellar biosynthesis component FlhA